MPGTVGTEIFSIKADIRFNLRHPFGVGTEILSIKTDLIRHPFGDNQSTVFVVLGCCILIDTFCGKARRAKAMEVLFKMCRQQMLR